MTSYQYWKSHCGDKTILRPSNLHNGISYTGKMTSFYWIWDLVTVLHVAWHWYSWKTPEAVQIYSSPPDKMAAILADDIFKCIFLNENDRISIRISLKFVPRSLVDNKPAWVQVMSWRQTGDKPLPEPMLIQFADVYMRHWGEMIMRYQKLTVLQSIVMYFTYAVYCIYFTQSRSLYEAKSACE